MAATKGKSTREQRAEARERRRSEAVGQDAEHDPAAALRGAASAAIVGAAVGAAQALARRRGETPKEEIAETVDERLEEVEQEPEPEPKREREPEAEPAAQPQAEGDAGELVRRAREHLRELCGVDSESVSSVSRTSGSWRIGLEVIELHRIPDSTDVLATYEVELDPDGALLGFTRKRRYTRSEADR